MPYSFAVKCLNLTISMSVRSLKYSECSRRVTAASSEIAVTYVRLPY